MSKHSTWAKMLRKKVRDFWQYWWLRFLQGGIGNTSIQKNTCKSGLGIAIVQRRHILEKTHLVLRPPVLPQFQPRLFSNFQGDGVEATQEGGEEGRHGDAAGRDEAEVEGVWRPETEATVFRRNDRPVLHRPGHAARRKLLLHPELNLLSQKPS